ncbi:hypothetical protein LTR95_004115 [Oleoguttula sp. CCFEE 5521]
MLAPPSSRSHTDHIPQTVIYPMDPDFRLTNFGHAVKEAIHKTLQTAAENQQYARDDSDFAEPHFTVEATRFIGAHVALLVEKCRQECIDSGEDYILDVNAEEALDSVIAESQPVRTKKQKALMPAPAKEVQKKEAKTGVEQSNDMAVLREQILANARELFPPQVPINAPPGVRTTDLLLRARGNQVIAFILSKHSMWPEGATSFHGAACASDLAALQSLDRMLKELMAEQWTRPA